MKADDIKKNRIRLGLSRDDLAKLIGVTRMTIANYEKGGGIPESKIEILKSVLLTGKSNTLSGSDKALSDYELYIADIDALLDIKRSEPKSIENLKAIHELVFMKLQAEREMKDPDNN